MRASANKKLAGLRRYHAARPARTRLKLLEALDRMDHDKKLAASIEETGKVVLPVFFKSLGDTPAAKITVRPFSR